MDEQSICCGKIREINSILTPFIKRLCRFVFGFGMCLIKLVFKALEFYQKACKSKRGKGNFNIGSCYRFCNTVF